MNDTGAVAAEGEWDDSPYAVAERDVSRRREILLAVLASALLVLVGVGGVYFTNLLRQRDATVQALDARISNLETANASLSKEVSDLGRETTDLLATRETLTRERDGLISERTGLVAQQASLTSQLNALAATRDNVAGERDQLNGRISVLDKQLGDLRGQLDAREQDLSAAQLESARQTSRADSAESKSQLGSQVISLDTSILKEYGTFVSWFSQLGDAYSNGDSTGFATAYSKCVDSANRLDGLKKQRDKLISQMGN